MTRSSHEQSLAAEDEGGGIEAKCISLIDNTKKSLDNNPAVGEDPEETEDEEVKVNCIGGFAGVEESDMSSDEGNSDEDNLSEEEESEEEEEEDSDEEEEVEKDGPVQFVSSQRNGSNIRRPRAVLANSPDLSQRRDEELDDDDDDSSMDESSDDDASSDEAGDIGMSVEDTKLEESDDEESLSDSSSRYDEDPSSAGGIAGSGSESEDSDEEDQDKDLEEETAIKITNEASQPEDEDMSGDESTTSVPLDCFKNCDGPSDVAELETALQDNKCEEQDDDASAASDDSAMDDLAQDSRLQSALLSNIEELESSPSKPDVLTHAKRTLSSSSLLGRASLSASNLAMLSPKRLCRPGDVESTSSDEDLPPGLSLGLAAFGNSQKVSLSDEDDEEQDRQLGEELRDGEEERERESTPIPLLTPPASPLRIDDDEGDTTVCEWPSNLAVDSAIVATMDLRPPSPENLQTWEQEEEERLMNSQVSPKLVSEKAVSSSLTPMLRGISFDPEAPLLKL